MLIAFGNMEVVNFDKSTFSWVTEVVVRRWVKSKLEAQRMETACVENPFRRFDREEEQKNVAITREVGGLKKNLLVFFKDGKL